ncbi:MAG: ADOP family duplicated permease, partial [Gemmatimonadaceae bacterium]
DEELRFHIDGRIDELVAQGMSRADAEREARTRFGDYRRIESEVQRLDRGSHRRRTLADRADAVALDFRYSIRALVAQPVFSGVVVATLTLGIAATSAIFHAVDRLVLHPLPYPNADRIVYLGWHWTKGSGADALSATKFQFWREESRVFDGVATSQTFEATLNDEKAGSVVRGTRVTADYLRLVGAHAALGRLFSPDEYTLGAPPVVLLNDGVWRSRFGGNPGVVGKQIRLDGQPYTVIGVMPPSFEVVDGSEWWQVIAPLAFTPTQLADGGNNYGVMGRLRAGVSMAQANDDMAAVFERWKSAQPGLVEKDDQGVQLKQYQSFLGDLAWELWTFLGATAFVLLLACANIANLLLARTLNRQREFAVRAALGAGRGRIARQVVMEMGILGVVSAVLATGASLMSLRAIVALANGSLLTEAQLRVNPRAVVFTTLVALGASVLVGMAVALSATRVDLARALSEGGRSGMASRGQRLVRSVLVSAEAALAMVLLAGAGLLVASFLKINAVDPGFQREGVFAARVPHAPPGYDSSQVIATFERHVLDRLRSSPGITSAGAASTLPLERGMNLPMTVEGRPDATEGGMEWRSASAGYFKTIGVRLIAGRDILDSDDAGAPPVVVISQAFAKRWWPGENPIGRRVMLGRIKGRLIGPSFDEPAREIVGIVPDLRDMSLAQTYMRSTAWVPLAQVARGMMRLPSFAVRASDPATAATALRSAIAEAEPRLAPAEVTAMSDIVSASLSRQRFTVVLMGSFAVLALLLTCVGIYGVVAYSAAQRVQEIGIRMALGAQRESVTRLVVWQGMRPAVVGLAVGCGAALLVSRLLTKMLYRVSPHDPAPLAVVALLLLAVSLIASYLPARRASRVDPLTALRAE